MSKHALLFFLIALSGCARYQGTPQDVTFVSSDGVALTGTLVLPEGAVPPMPTVLLLHGAEPATRSFAYRMHANLFLERGLAVFLYDKRGAGASGGDHDAATYAQLIDDALAAITMLRARPEVDAAQLGLVGASESGWFTPEIAERAGGLAFVINKVGPCLSWRETVDWEVYNDLLAEDVPEPVAREQTEVFRQLWAYYLSPSPAERSALEATLGTWAGRDGSLLPRELSAVDASALQDMGYDPGPYLERLATPMLYVYGGKDINVPAARCAERLTALRNAGMPVAFHVFEEEGHELGGVGLSGYQFADGYAAMLGDFAERHLGE